jgi:tetratricopeptide (TPR) repeat protein
MSSDHVTSAVNSISAPSHHSGPGYVTNRKASDVELDDQLRDAAARWLNFVPSEHRRGTPGSAKSALETLEEHVRSCREHPLRALWVAHRHLQDPSPAIRIASLVLASEALWWLGHFRDAQIAAQAAVDADPESAQARWRLAVALYRQGRFDHVLQHLDNLLQSVKKFAPGWALRGQAKVWLAPDDPDAGRTDFGAAAALESDKWVVPQRMGRAAFRAAVDAEIARFDSEMGSSSSDPDVGIELLPAESVAGGADPDIRWEVASGPGAASVNPSASPFAVLGGEFAVETRAQVVPGTRFVLYQRNIENLCKDNATLGDEIRKSVAELYKVALHADETISYKGAPEYHAEAEDAPDDEGG